MDIIGQNQKTKKFISQLFAFAYFPKYDESITHLAEKLTAREEWNFSDAPTGKYGILKSYLEYTYRRLKYEQKIVHTHDNKYVSFNTGLVTENMQDIYAFFEKHKRSGNQPYVFKAFLKESDNLLLKHFSENLPEVANYFEQPDLLIYNPKLRLIINVDHIIEDNADRFPEHLSGSSNQELRMHLNGAIEEVKKLVRINYKIAVPQFHRNRIQLLFPLKLTMGSSNADLALVISKLNATTYTARTCLTLRMAYNNARLIVSPQSNWLKP